MWKAVRTVTNSRRTGKSPDHDRAVEMVRQGRPLSAIQMATGIPSATIKRWAKNAGLTVVMPTMAERLEREERGAEMAKTRRLYRIGITAEVLDGRRRTRYRAERPPAKKASP
jgi:hypothetical protein